MTGTDRDQPWLLAVYCIAVAAVAASLALRLGAGRDSGARVPVVAAAAILALVVVVGLARIPLAAAPGKHAVATASRPAVTSSFSGPLTAAISTQDGSTARLLSVAGSAGRRSAVAFRIDLVTDGQAVTDSSLQVRFHAGRGVALCSGDITSIDDSGFAGTCALPDGATRAVSGTWSISGSSVTGRLVSQAA